MKGSSDSMRSLPHLTPRDYAATLSLCGIPWWVMMFNARHRMPTSLACCWGLRLATPPPKIVFIRNIAVSPSERR